MIWLSLLPILVFGGLIFYYIKFLVHINEYNRVRLENFVLRDALREANAELFKHRQLISGLQTGQKEITEAFERAITGKSVKPVEPT